MNLRPLLAAFEALLPLLYPERCQLCAEHAAGPVDGYVCDACRAGVKWVADPCCDRCGLPFQGVLPCRFECPNCQEDDFTFRQARALFVSSGPGRELVHRYKYQRALWFEPLFARWLEQTAVPQLRGGGWTGVVPVPLHPAKRREREFNQAARIGALLARALAVPLCDGLVERRIPTETQTRLTREERRRNVRSAFHAAKPELRPGTRWIVVDDVFTTGATTDAVARILRDQGAEDVVVWTLARGI
jgi:ComF family protein